MYHHHHIINFLFFHCFPALFFDIFLFLRHHILYCNIFDTITISSICFRYTFQFFGSSPRFSSEHITPILTCVFHVSNPCKFYRSSARLLFHSYRRLPCLVNFNTYCIDTQHQKSSVLYEHLNQLFEFLSYLSTFQPSSVLSYNAAASSIAHYPTLIISIPFVLTAFLHNFPLVLIFPRNLTPSSVLQFLALLRLLRIQFSVSKPPLIGSPLLKVCHMSISISHHRITTISH